MSHPEAGRAAGALGVLSLIWGYNWVVMKAGLAWAAPLDYAGWRFLLAGAALVPVVWAMRQSIRVPRDEWWIAAVLAALLAANFTCTLSSLALGGTARTAVLTYTMPFWTLLLARVFLHERMGWVRWLAVALAASGLVVLVDPAHLTGLLSSALAIGAGLSWAASIVLVKVRQGQMRAGVLALTVWQMLGAAVLLFSAAHLLDTRPTQWTGGFGAALLYTSLIASTFAWIAFYYALARLPAGLTALGTLATPVVGVLAAWLQLGERPTPSELAGMALIGFGLALLAWPVPPVPAPAARG